MEGVGKVIREQRKLKKLTQAQLAGSVGMSRATLSAIENGTVPEVGIRKVEALLRVLGYALVAVPAKRRPTLDEVRSMNIHG
jgi:HTH-type transcriptional regulator/antitoxin HipB